MIQMLAATRASKPTCRERERCYGTLLRKLCDARRIEAGERGVLRRDRTATCRHHACCQFAARAGDRLAAKADGRARGRRREGRHGADQLVDLIVAQGVTIAGHELTDMLVGRSVSVRDGDGLSLADHRDDEIIVRRAGGPRERCAGRPLRGGLYDGFDGMALARRPGAHDCEEYAESPKHFE